LITKNEEEEQKHCFWIQHSQQLLFEVENVPSPTPKNYTLNSIDLFAELVDFRIALQNLGGKCVFYLKEWDKFFKSHIRQILGGTFDITEETTKSYIP
jgi:DNA (cytosine-5)-methyltransferase 1